MKRIFKSKLFNILLLSALFIALLALKKNNYIAEYVFSRHIARAYLYIVGFFSSLVPFSIFELLIAIGIIYLIALIVKIIKSIKRKNFTYIKNRLSSLLIIMLSFLVVYTSAASFSYNRNSINFNLNYSEPEKESVYTIADYFLGDFNSLALTLSFDENGNVINPYTFDELSQKCIAEFKRLQGDGFLNTKLPRVKPVFFSSLMTYYNISGIFFAPTAEPNINKNIPTKDLPVTFLHELAHSAGIMKEDEANQIAYYLALTSKDDFIRYSGYHSSFSQMLSAVFFTSSSESYQQLVLKMDDKIIKEKSNGYDFWMKHNSFISTISGFFNDLYLKLSGINEGTDSYDNNFDLIDTGEKDEDGDIIFDIDYSIVQKFYFSIYNNLNNLPN